MSIFAKNNNEMDEGKEYVGTAIFFAAGVAAASYSIKAFYIGNGAVTAASAISLCLCIGTALLAWRLWRAGVHCGSGVRCGESGGVSASAHFPRAALPAIFLAFFFAGVFASSTTAIPSLVSTAPSSDIFTRSSAAIKDLISALPFSERSSNSLVKAFLTGDQSGLTADVRAAFRDSGASHILALSGMHLSIIYLVVSHLLSFMGNAPAIKAVRSVIITLGSAFFTVMTGAAPSLVRAFFFILLRECAMLSCRRTDNIGIFSMALLLQLTVTPQAVTSVGFQLSYLAMLGIFLLYRPLEGLWDKSIGANTGSSAPARVISATMRQIWSMCALSIACQAFTGPAVLLYFGTFPQYFLITNLLCIPLSNAIMVISLIILPLRALGICPSFLISLDDWLAQLIIRVLDIISYL